MIGSFASEAPGPAMIPPEQVEILAHKVSCKNCFCRSFQILARLLKREIFSDHGGSPIFEENANRSVETFGAQPS
jgi:hypothetical protein